MDGSNYVPSWTDEALLCMVPSYGNHCTICMSCAGLTRQPLVHSIMQSYTGRQHTFMSVEAVAIRLGTPGLKDIAQVAASCAESLNRGAEPGPDLAS